MSDNSGTSILQSMIRGWNAPALRQGGHAPETFHTKTVPEKWMEALRIQVRVIGAIMLRDMRTRFGRTHLAYMIAILWPLSHLLALLTVYSITIKLAPIGSNVTVFVGSGLLPYILIIYPSRQIMLAVAVNLPLLHFPIVKTTDLIISRVLLEIVNTSVVVAAFIAILYAIGIDFMPLDPFEALMAICASVCLGVGFGICNVIGWAFLKQGWNIMSVIGTIIMYVTAGVLWLPSALSPTMREILWYNPMLHCVEWLRSAYYEGYGEDMLTKSYVVGMGLTCIFLGFLGDRVLRGRLQQG
jgi:capsular polysaccharide transport system permease protein